MMSISGYCIPRGITSINFPFSLFYPQNTQKGAPIGVLKTHKIFKLSYDWNYWSDCDQILHSEYSHYSDKDHQLLFVDRPKICPTNPRWQTVAIL